jgi:hypothetical protein
MYTKLPACALAGVLGLVALPGCSLDVPDLNNPGLNQLENTPTAALVNSAASGLQVGIRGGKSATTGLVNQLGILGRESYDFDSADGRFVTEEIQGPLNRSDAFGGVFWALNYANIQLGNSMLHALDKVVDFDDVDKAGITGFVHTMQALDLLTVIVTHDATGAVIDTDRALGAELAPFVSKDAVYVEIARLLDAALPELGAAGKTFTFALNTGFTGFTTPAKFIAFNRAIKARVAVYQKDYPAAISALAASFIVDDPTMPINFKLGAYYPYSTGSGDVTNGLINKAIYAHPGLKSDVELQTDGKTPDARYTAKIGDLTSTVAYPTDDSLKTTIKFVMYTNVTPVALIRNEELILLKAEALWFTGDKAGALAELNLVRTKSGLLPALTAVPADDTAFTDALLFERRYSLLFEGGHRWIDLRRFGRELPLDDPSHTRNVRFPVPQAECDARSDEPACDLTSASPAP